MGSTDCGHLWLERPVGSEWRTPRPRATHQSWALCAVNATVQVKEAAVNSAKCHKHRKAVQFTADLVAASAWALSVWYAREWPRRRAPTRSTDSRHPVTCSFCFTWATSKSKGRPVIAGWLQQIRKSYCVSWAEEVEGKSSKKRASIPLSRKNLYQYANERSESETKRAVLFYFFFFFAVEKLTAADL